MGILCVCKNVDSVGMMNLVLGLEISYQFPRIFVKIKFKDWFDDEACKIITNEAPEKEI